MKGRSETCWIKLYLKPTRFLLQGRSVTPAKKNPHSLKPVWAGFLSLATEASKLAHRGEEESQLRVSPSLHSREDLTVQKAGLVPISSRGLCFLENLIMSHWAL